MEYSEILARFPDAKKIGEGYQTRCPAHNGKGDTSLSIKQNGNKILFHCFGDCTTEQIVASVGLKMSDLFNGNGKGRSAKGEIKQKSASISPQWQQNRWGHKKPFRHPQLGEPVKKYPYPDEKGNLLYYICRFEPGLNGEKKALRPCPPDGLSWGIKGIRRVLYRLLEILNVLFVILVEGERDADTLALLDFDSTAFPFGAGSFKAGNYAESLRGKTVYILPDNDDAGAEMAQTVSRYLKGVAASVRILEVKGMQPGWDITDYLEQHGPQVTAEDVTDAINKSTEFTENNKTETGTGAIEVISFAEIEKQKFEDKPVIGGLLDEMETLMITGPSGIGKSAIINQVASTVAYPPPDDLLWGRFPIPGPVTSVIIQSENSIKAQSKRLKMLYRDNDNLRHGADQVFVARLHGASDIRFVGDLSEFDFQERLCEAINLVDARLLVLDPLISYHRANENDNMEMRAALDCLQVRVLDKTGASAIICHHFNRQGETRGASAIRDWTANLLLLEVAQKRDDGTVIKVTHNKARNFPQVDPFYLERTPGLDFIPIEKPDSKKDEQVDEAATILARMGGRCESQSALKKSIMKELNCSESKARRIIKDALGQKKILIDPGDIDKKGVAVGYYLPK